MAYAAGQGDLVGFEPHARTTPVAEAAPLQLIGDIAGLHREPGREAFDNDNQGAAVRFARGEIAQHARTLPDGYSPSGAAELTRKPGTAAEDL